MIIILFLQNFNLIVISTYCNCSPNAAVLNSLVVGSYSSSLGSTANVSCLTGYQSSGLLVATCVAYNITQGIWNVPGTCNSTNNFPIQVFELKIVGQGYHLCER